MSTDNFTLYEIDQAYQSAQDRADQYAAEHNGEMLPEHYQALDALEMTRDIKIENSIKYIKNQKAMAEMIESEIETLKARAKAHTAAAERNKAYLAYIIKPKEKHEYGCGKISWRESQKLIVDAPNLVPDQYVKIETSIKVQEIKDAIKAGEKIEFAHIETIQNIQIK